MAISSLVVRSGIGSWGDIAHLITRGLDIGTSVAVWTDNSSPSTTWAPNNAASNVWTANAAASTTWTNN